MIITQTDFAKYLNLPLTLVEKDQQTGEDTGIIGEEDMNPYILAAEDVVKQTLDYDPSLGEYTQIIRDQTDIVHLEKIPLVGNAIKLDGQWYSFKYNVKDEWLYFDDKITGTLTYSAGYPYKDMPAIIKLTTLRIQALLREESEGDIGITSKDFGDAGGRSFLQYNNFNKYTRPLNGFRRLSA